MIQFAQNQRRSFSCLGISPITQSVGFVVFCCQIFLINGWVKGSVDILHYCWTLLIRNCLLHHRIQPLQKRSCCICHGICNLLFPQHPLLSFLRAQLKIAQLKHLQELQPLRWPQHEWFGRLWRQGWSSRVKNNWKTFLLWWCMFSIAVCHRDLNNLRWSLHERGFTYQRNGCIL